MQFGKLKVGDRFTLTGVLYVKVVAKTYNSVPVGILAGRRLLCTDDIEVERVDTPRTGGLPKGTGGSVEG